MTEYRAIIFNAARDGHLVRLRNFLETKPAPELSSCLNMDTFGAPLLLIAARQGHARVVEYLVTKGADVEQSGAVNFDGDNIAGARPLWAAAAAGHTKIVQFLLARGADVNNRTHSNSTPLRAACFDGHSEIVKLLLDAGADAEIPNRYGHTTLMIACFRGHLHICRQLIEHGVNVNQTSHKGNTALHDAAEVGDLDIVKLLLEHGAVMQKDTFGTTPILTAAAIGHANVVEYLVGTRGDTVCSLEEKISGLELLGATYVDKQRDLINGGRFWQQALYMRLGSDESLGFRTKPPREPIAAYAHEKEVNTVEELSCLTGDPEGMRMQALLVRERILGPSHPDTTYYIRFRGAVYMDLANYDRCFDLWIYAVKLQQEILEPLCVMTLGSLVAFTELFAYVLTDTVRERITQRRQEMLGAGGADLEKVPRRVDVIRVLQCVLREVRRTVLDKKEASLCSHQPGSPEATRESHMHRLSLICIHLASVYCRLEAQKVKGAVDDVGQTFRQTLYDLVALNPTGEHGASLLHLACSHESSVLGSRPVFRFPSLPVIRCLLEVNANPGSRDRCGNTALHVLLKNKVARPSIAKCLLDSGAHLDSPNGLGQRPVDMLKPIRGCDESNIKPLEFISLKCIAARFIREKRIVLKRPPLKELQEFLDRH